MKKKIKRYQVGLDSETYAISLVENPAIEETFIYMSEDKQDVMLSSDEKHLVYGAILVPDKPIYRNDGENEYYITFTKDSIEKMSKDYMREYRQSNVTLEHSEEVSETTLVESWIKTDLYKDKSVALGLNEQLPVGTWFGGFYVNNVELWDKVKSGEVKGFSVEAMINLEDLNFNKQEETSMDDMNFWQKMNDLLVSTLGMRDNSKKEEVEETQLEAQEQVQESVEAPIVEEVKEDTTQEEKEAVEAPVQEEKPIVEEAPKPNEDLTKLQDLVENLKAELEALKEQNTTLEGKVKEMGKQPSAKPLNTAKGSSTNNAYAAWREAMGNFLR